MTIAYSNVWEDYNIIKSKLELNKDDIFVSICSSGDQILNVLSEKTVPYNVYCIDYNASQINLFILTLSAIKELDRQEFLYFIGFDNYQSDETRMETFERLEMDDKVRKFFIENYLEWIDKGIKKCGQLESFLSKIKLYKDDKETLEKYLNEKLSSGRDDSKLKYYDKSKKDFSDTMYERYEKKRDLKNPYNNALFGDCIIPYVQYMHENYYETLKDNLKKVEIAFINDSIQNFIQSNRFYNVSVKWNLSDLFEYLSEEEFHGVVESMKTVSNTNQILVYWNLVVDRIIENAQQPDDLDDGVLFYKRYLVYQF